MSVYSRAKQILSRRELLEPIRRALERRLPERTAFFTDHRSRRASIDALVVLQRWNSSSPAIPRSAGDSGRVLGGGYALYWRGKCIVIDPGLGFVENFAHNGFRIRDIDAVFVTHAHIDHCGDLDAVLMLLHEFNEDARQNRRPRTLDLFLNLGTLSKLSEWLRLDNPLIGKITVLNHDVALALPEYSLVVTPFATGHDEQISTEYACGLIMSLRGEDDIERCRVALTSDARIGAISQQDLSDTDVLIAHLGTVHPSEVGGTGPTEPSSHLRLQGVARVMNRARAGVTVLSEFGEEIGPYRSVISGALRQAIRSLVPEATCLAADVGFTLRLPDCTVACQECGEVVPAREIVDYVYDDEIRYACASCATGLMELGG